MVFLHFCHKDIFLDDGMFLDMRNLFPLRSRTTQYKQYKQYKYSTSASARAPVKLFLH